MPDTPSDKPIRSAEVIDFTAYRNRDLIDVLQVALEDARSGRITGAIMVLQREWINHGVVIVGSYEGDADKICNIAGQLFLRFGPQQSDRPTIIG